MSIAMQTPFKTTVKWAFLGWLGYGLLTIVASVFITSNWMAGQDLTGLTQNQIATLMDKDGQVSFITSLTGASVAILLAFLITRKTATAGYRTSIVFAIGLFIFGIVGIFAHPDHTLIHQMGKLVAPFVTCGFGAWLALRNV